MPASPRNTLVSLTNSTRFHSTLYPQRLKLSIMTAYSSYTLRGYLVSREDWYLFPEGRILTELPYDWEGKYVAEMQDLGREQQAWVDAQDWSRPVPTRK
jgi:hypothetical protein